MKMGNSKDNPFAELLERLSGDSDDDGEGHHHEDGHKCPAEMATHTRLTPAEMIQHLRVGYSLLTRESSLKQGDIVRGIRELTESHIRNWDDPHILVEILAEPIKIHVDPESIGQSTASKHYDCVIASCVPHKGNGWVICHFADLRDLELYPNADQLKVETHS